MEKGGHAVVMGRITPGKGQHLAARLAHECGFDLVLAGPVGPYRQPADLAADGAAANPDVCYWEDNDGTLPLGRECGCDTRTVTGRIPRTPPQPRRR